jgi:ACS family glucarate transporter-like MFS transporter
MSRVAEPNGGLLDEAVKAQAPGATGARHRVVWFGAAIAFLSFLDRAAISQAAPSMIRDLHLSAAQMGLVFSAFGFTYAALELPSGWLCDRFGARKVLTRVIVVWSFFTALTAVAWSFTSLYVMRLLFGAGESGCFPALASVFRRWLPQEERNLAEGVKAASARWGAAVAPVVIVALYGLFTWRQVFVLFGALGVAVGVAFFLWYRDDPRDHPGVNEAEARLIPRRAEGRGHVNIPWAKISRSRSVWALGIQWFSHYYGFYFYITWLPIYLYQVRKLDLRHGALAAGFPLFTAGLGCLFGGWALTALSRRIKSIARARRWIGYFSYGGAGVILLVCPWTTSPLLAVIAMGLSSFAAEFSSPISWTSAMDIGGESVGVVSGFMNTLGQLGGAVAPAITGFLLTFSGNAWNVAFYASAGIYLAGALCWVVIDPVTPVDAVAIER